METVESPAIAVMLPVLVRAIFVEDLAIKQVALANVLDVASVLAPLPPPPTMPAEGDEEEQADVVQQQQQQLESMMQWVPQLLYGPTLDMQTLAALGLSRIVLHRLDEYQSHLDRRRRDLGYESPHHDG